MAEAAAWKSRLDSPEAAASEFLAFEAWLGAPGARESFDRIETLTGDIEANRDIIGQAMVHEDAERIAQLQSATRRSPPMCAIWSARSRAWLMRRTSRRWRGVLGAQIGLVRLRIRQRPNAFH